MLGISVREYARRNGVYHRAIQFAVEVGIIVPLIDGSIDPDQADATWGVLHAGRLAGPTAPDPVWAARIDAELAAIDRDLGGWTPMTTDEMDALLAGLLDEL